MFKGEFSTPTKGLAKTSDTQDFLILWQVAKGTKFSSILDLKKVGLKLRNFKKLIAIYSVFQNIKC